MDDKLNRQDWLNAGLKKLALEGPEGLRIMPLAQELGVTKGSFYWHFENHGEYQTALLEEWEQGYTHQIIRDVEQAGGDPETMLRHLMTITVGVDARLARAIRSWAITNPDVRKAQARVDRKRIAYVTKLLATLGWAVDDAGVLARWTYCALIGHFSLDGPQVGDRQIELILSTLMPK